MNTPPKGSGGRLWVREVKHSRTLRDITLPCEQQNPLPALREAMHALDLGMPIWLPRHQADWQAFGLTRFSQEHFLESVNFDRLEISYLAPEEQRKPPRSPNGFE